MIYVVDEALGLIPQNFNEANNSKIISKPIILTDQSNSLTHYLRNNKRRLFNASVPWRKYSLEDEINFFSEMTRDYEDIIYFYQEQYTDSANLARVRTLMLPNKRLIYIPIEHNIAKVCYYIKCIDQYFATLCDHPMLSEVQRLAQKLDYSTESYVLSPKPILFLNLKKMISLQNNKKYEIFKSLSIENNNRVRFEAVERIEKLLQETISKFTDYETWMVTKGLHEVASEADHVFQVSEESLPHHVPYVHLFMVPKNQAIAEKTE